MALLADRDIFNLIACEWLELKDLVYLDSAIVNKEMRLMWSILLQTVPFKIPFQNQVEKWWKHHKHCLSWMIKRSMFESDGELTVHWKLWSSLLDDKTHNYLPFIERLRKLRFQGFNGTNTVFDYRGLENCHKLQQLRICNLYTSVAVHENVQLCPQLEIIEFHNTIIDNNVLKSFMQCRKLKKAVFHHGSYDVQNLTSEFLEPFLQSLEEITVLSKVNEFILCFGTVSNQLSKLTLDEVQPDSAVDLTTLLTHSPNLKTLCLTRLRIDPASFFPLMSKHCRHIQSVHLDHCRLDITPVSTNNNTGTGASKLQLSSLLCGPSSVPLQDLVAWNRQFLQHLHVSFCDEIDVAQYRAVLQQCPRLATVEIETKKQCWEGSEGRDKLNQFVQLFAGVANVRVVVWSRWLRESEKAEQSEGREVIYTKGSL